MHDQAQVLGAAPAFAAGGGHAIAETIRRVLSEILTRFGQISHENGGPRRNGVGNFYTVAASARRIERSHPISISRSFIQSMA